MVLALCQSGPDVRAALPADGAHELILDVGYPQLVRPAISIVGRDVEVAAAMSAIDPHLLHASGAHLAKSDLLRAADLTMWELVIGL